MLRLYEGCYLAQKIDENTFGTINTDKATLIWYHALQNLWPNAEFKDAVSVIVNSARLLLKNGKVPSGTTQVVRAAFKAEGLTT